MKLIPVIGLVLLLAFQSCSTTTDETEISAEKSVLVKMDESMHGFDLVNSLSNSSLIGSKTNKVLSTDTISDNLYLTQYISGNRFLGTVIWTIENGDFNPLWQEKDSSDFPPHTFSFVDFNNDGRKDLTVLFGQEDVYGTDVYLNQSAKTYSKDNFKLAYQNWNDYLVIVDIDGDGVPELLDSGYEGTEHVEGPEFFLTDEVRERIHQKYDEIAHVKGANNFHFNMPNHFKVFNSFLLDSIKVVGFENGEFVDKTCRYQDYLDWRIAILKQMKSDGRNDSKRIEGLINYLEKKKICI
ncbi:FG-GAP repeat domain-containing protein [Pontibacter liquoris]|uniref:FG-GAP repeat domain-containing protein n=1 Tax=Pontibacter liquoris TaxID=2905677 RepID=UPI001FA6CAD7|nr:VCBS repeat-containing protein [Pontibacter liquoris]